MVVYYASVNLTLKISVFYDFVWTDYNLKYGYKGSINNNVDKILTFWPSSPSGGQKKLLPNAFVD